MDTATDVLEYKLRGSARAANIIVGFMLLVLVITAPLAIWMWVRSFTAKAMLTAQTLEVKRFFGSVRIDLTQVERLGLYAVPVPAGNLVGVLAQMRVGGAEAVHLCALDQAGKTRQFMVSPFANSKDLMKRLSDRVGKPVEAIERKNYRVVWPLAAAA